LSTQERVEFRGRDTRPDPVTGSVAGAGKAGADRLPRPPGRRRPGLAVLAVLLIVLGAAVAGLLALRIDERVPVLVARQQIAVGQQISADDLAVARVAAEGLALIPAERASEVIGKYATAQIGAGRLVDPATLSDSGLLTSGNAAVGIALQPGRYPASGLESGDVVQVVRAVDGEGKVIADRAVVGSVQTPADSVFGSAGSDTVVVTVVLTQPKAAAVAAAAAADQVSLVLLRRGEPVSGN
jgi:SAF domain